MLALWGDEKSRVEERMGWMLDIQSVGKPEGSGSREATSARVLGSFRRQRDRRGRGRGRSGIGD